MKTIKRIAVLLLLTVLLVPTLSGCRKKPSAVKPGTYCRISYEGNTNDLFSSLEYPTTYWAKPGDAVEVRTEILCDADIVVEADGVPVEKSHYDSDYWGYSFIMPDHNVVVTLRAVSGWKS